MPPEIDPKSMKMRCCGAETFFERFGPAWRRGLDLDLVPVFHQKTIQSRCKNRAEITENSNVGQNHADLEVVYASDEILP